jgi:trk system potassium uptake protein TrkH
MFFGGCSGSTAGGFKCIRGIMVLEVVRNELRRVLHPRAVLPVRVNRQPVPFSTQATLLGYFALYLMLCLLTYFIMILTGVDSTNSITIALSCASNVGPTLGLEIGPTMSWDVLPDLVKWLLTLLMLMGRLEIVSVVVLFTRSFWRDR